VVPEDLVELHEVGTVLLEPAREPLVQLGARRFRQRVVGRVADEQVAKAVSVVVRQESPLRPHEVFADESDQLPVHLLPWRERQHGAAVEDLALDRAAFEHVTLGGLELIEARGQKRLDRRGHRYLAALLGDRQHLLDEERVAAGRVEDPAAELLGDALRERCDQLHGLVRGERLQQDVARVQLAAAPSGPLVEQLGPRHAEQQDRRVAAQVGDVLDEVEEGRLAPVQIVEDHNQRPLGRS
jgi:hypothetical protein